MMKSIVEREKLDGLEETNAHFQNTVSGSNETSDTESDTETHNNDTENNEIVDVETRLLNLLLRYPSITQQQAAEQLGYSKTWIRKIMKKLREQGILYIIQWSVVSGQWAVF